MSIVFSNIPQALAHKYYYFQVVIDNKNAMTDLFNLLNERVKKVTEAFEGAESEGAKIRIEKFVGYVIYYELRFQINNC